MLPVGQPWLCSALPPALLAKHFIVVPQAQQCAVLEGNTMLMERPQGRPAAAAQPALTQPLPSLQSRHAPRVLWEATVLTQACLWLQAVWLGPTPLPWVHLQCQLVPAVLLAPTPLLLELPPASTVGLAPTLLAWAWQ